jgi:DNA-binding protein Fis
MIQDPYNPAPNFVSTPPTPPKGRRNLWIAITCVIVLIVAVGTLLVLELLGVFASPASNHAGTNTQPTATTAAGGSTPSSGGTTPTTNPSGGSVTPQQATAVLTQYYANINAQNYQSAYNLWGSNYRSSTSYATFAQGFANTQKDTLQVGNAIALSDGTVKVPVTITSVAADVASTTISTYQGYYIVGQEQGSTKLLSASLQLTNSTNDRVNQAIAVLTQYYAHINAKDYQDAYNLWGTAYHNSTTYQQFVAGFANTQSVSFTVQQGAMVLNEGSVKVPVTIRSLDKTQSGVVTHTYQGYYIIGTEGSTWQLFSASIQ